jgi:hypothetical protein
VTFLTSGTDQNGALNVKKGDSITVQYNDPFPANFADTLSNHKFNFVVSVGAMGTMNSTTPSVPTLKDVQGKTLSSVQQGQQVVLSTTVNNNENQETPFVAIVEVRDSNDVTTYLAWQTGTLNANGHAEVGLSWTPSQSGNYQVRTFILSDLSNPSILSAVQSSQITVT